MSPRDIGKQLNLLRVSAGMSMFEAGTLLGVTRQTLRLWEAGKRMPRVDVYFQALEAYGASKPTWHEFGNEYSYIDLAPPLRDRIRYSDGT